MISINTSTNIAFISSYLPRKCGIATFTSDLINNIALASNGNFAPSVIAMQSDNTFKYPHPVKIKIRKDIKYDYITAADYINYSGNDLAVVQHEFGLYGGPGGSYLNLLLQRINKPVVSILHTVLEKPTKEHYESFMQFCEMSRYLVVMNRRGIKMLSTIYKVPQYKIRLISHGIPDLPFEESAPYKKQLRFENRKIILTFGLISRNKGIEIMLKAMPYIAKAEPDALYIILGMIHPEVLRNEGLKYKHELEQMIRQLQIQNNVIFCNRFVDDQMLSTFLMAADIYVTPYLHKEQLTSGTLAFAVGTGNAVVSTPYWAAQELLAHGRGRLVRFADAKHTAKTIVNILQDKVMLESLRKKAYKYSRPMTWPRIGRIYWEFLTDITKSAKIPLRTKLEPILQNQTNYRKVNSFSSA